MNDHDKALAYLLKNEIDFKHLKNMDLSNRGMVFM